MKKQLPLLFILVSLILASCSKDDDEEEVSPYSTYRVELEAGEKYIINDMAGVNFGSDDWYVASVSHTGLLTAEREGKTWIRANGHRLLEVTVTPRYHWYKNPYLDFGCSTSQLKKKLGKPNREDDTFYIYEEGDITVAYILEQGTMQQVEVWLPWNYSYYILPYLHERYALVAGYSEGSLVAEFSNALYLEHASVLVLLEVDYPYYVVTYLPYVHSD